MRVIALDLARGFGWRSGEVIASPAATVGGHGIFGKRKDAIHEIMFADALATIAGLIAGHGLCVYEAPIPPIFKKGMTNIATTRIAFGLAAITEAVCRRDGIEVREARVSDVRDHFIQTHKLKGLDGKRAIFNRAALIGFRCADFDESDAAALWHYQVSFLSPRTAIRSTPLFAERS